MRLFRIILTLVAFSVVLGRAEAPPFFPGQHDGEGAKLLRRMSQVIPLRTTRLQTVAPEFAIEKRAGLTWTDAVAEADANYGKKDPKRFAFLRRYLVRGSPEINLADLHSTMSAGNGAGSRRSVHYSLHGPFGASLIGIGVYLDEGKLSADPTLVLPSVTIDGMTYSYLTFDSNDRLIRASLQLPLKPGVLTDGWTLQVSQSIEGDSPFYSLIIYGPTAERESIHFTSEFGIKERSVSYLEGKGMTEIYENGKLRRRVYQNQRQVQGGRMSYIEKEETFP